MYDHTMRRLALILLAGCGRVGFDTRDGTSPPDVAVSAGLVAYYPMDSLDSISSSVSSAPDATGRGHTGLCELDPALTCPTVVPGHIGNAYQFDGIDDLVRVTDMPDLETTSGFTIAAWIETHGVTSAEGCPFSKPLGPAYYNTWELCVRSDLSMYFYSVTGGTEDLQNLTGTLTIDTWHHVAIRWDGSAKRASLDGVDVAISPASIEWDGSDILFGLDIDNGGPIAQFPGAIDDLRIYNRALDITEIRELANM
jgi:hypothetical protein